MPVPDGNQLALVVRFVCDQLANGRRFRVFSAFDDFGHECVVQITDFSISDQRWAGKLDRLARNRSLPGTVILGNGPELTAKAMFFWSKRTGVKLHFIQPGKPAQNAFIVSFNSKFHDTCLSQHWFPNLAYAPTLTEDWRREYNEERPKKILGV